MRMGSCSDAPHGCPTEIWEALPLLLCMVCSSPPRDVALAMLQENLASGRVSAKGREGFRDPPQIIRPVLPSGKPD